MASLTDFYQPAAVSPQFATYELNAQGTDLTTNAGLAQKRLKDLYENRTLPGLVNREASKGSFYSGNAGVRGDEVRQDYQNASGDISLNLRQSLADLSRRRLYAQLGVSV